MKKLRIKSLSLLSTKTQSGNHFAFSDHINLIQSASNARGKSTLVNLIYWALGCNFQLDSWAKTMYCRVAFTINDELYSVFRTPNDLFYLQRGDQLQKFEELGQYQATLNSLFGINIQLKDHNGNIRNARPAHYFATSYISQEKGWNDFFSPPFEGLGEFKHYKKPLVEQFTYRIPEQLPILEKKSEELRLAIQQKKIQQASIVALEKSLATENPLESKVEPLAQEHQSKLNELNRQLDSITLERTDLREKIAFIQKETEEMDKDYQFAMSIDGPIICPQCGTAHKNGTNEAIDLAAHANALSLYEQEYQEEYKTLTAKSEQLTKQINELKTQYLIDLEETFEAENNALLNIVTLKAVAQLESRLSRELDALEQEKKPIVKELRQQKNRMKAERETADKYFIARLKHYADKLCLSLQYDNIKSPVDYNKVRKDIIDAGAADKNRCILAYYLAIYETAMQSSTCDMLPPLVVDTPMQNDQDPENYQAILHLLATQQNKQIFVCLINTGTLLQEYPELHRITVNKDLTADKFNEIKQYFEVIL
ncbi:hypothetical protein [Actinobacillus minor]|uniref:hypothetical protein n=1 Tax=Actinobacillus minor TaxID=51047 RepID=UPI0023F08648|nr:hypothetical protein [Actinobacillus minor]MDD6911276.1 hypothetical protein [Actinobacillus minor]MDY4713540.1 hypothetical protein [Actinobacillus minor]